MPGGRVGICGGGACGPAPRYARQRGRRMPAVRPITLEPPGPELSALGIAERQSHETRALARLHSKQQSVLAFLAGVRELLADIRRVCNRLAADVEDDVADLEA